MRILGAVLAGGQSSRFGSDKAAALFESKPLIDRVIAALEPQVEALVISGRDWPGRDSIADLPAAGLGPLGGLCAALLEAERRGFDAVLCAPCDALGLPGDLATRLAPGPAVAAGQQAVGLWPVALAETLLARLAAGGGRSIHGFMAAYDVAEVDCGPIRNVNRPEDLR